MKLSKKLTLFTLLLALLFAVSAFAVVQKRGALAATQQDSALAATQQDSALSATQQDSALAATQQDSALSATGEYFSPAEGLQPSDDAGVTDDFIKWVDFNVQTKTLLKVYELAKKYYKTDIEFNFTEVLAYLSVKNGNRFSDNADLKTLNKLVAAIKSGEKISEIISGNKYYGYYLKCYQAIFARAFKETDEGALTLATYFPLANGHWYNHYDDFGKGRSYGFKRKHLGHDIMGSVGTPITAVEGGTVTAMGWNKYGGWRVGIMSADGQRYYYYAHLRKDKPFAEGLEVGSLVAAGQHIGYLGMTGYSTKENTNLKTGKPHLHIGLQLIFDESQIEGNGEIWIDLYSLTNLWARNKATV